MSAIVASKTLTKSDIMDIVYTDLLNRMKGGVRKDKFSNEEIVWVMMNADTIYGADVPAKARYIGYMVNSAEHVVLPVPDTYLTNVVLVTGDVITAGIVLDDGERVLEVGTTKTYGAGAVVSYSKFKKD